MGTVMGILAAAVIAIIVVLGNVFDRLKSMEARMKKLEGDMDTINEGYGIVFRKMKEITDTLGTISEINDGIGTSISKVLDIVKSIKESDSA